jgi:hypothetical protein
MKKILLLFFGMGFLINSCFSQLSFSSKQVTLQMEPGVDKKATIDISNNNIYDIDLEWELVSNSLNNNWAIQFCECTSCYTNDFSPIEQSSGGGQVCPTMTSGGPKASWYLTVDPGSEPQTYAEWKVVVKNLTDNISDTLIFAAEPANNVNSALISNEISIYPNPATDLINIQIDNSKYKKLEYSIYNIVGKAIKSGRLMPDNSEIQINELRSGVYFLNLRDEGVDLLNEKIIVK